ncbi:MAG: DUF885 domain-containing protein [Planctomycetota bacterium]|jgi:uncharacterized protein (DUF885 family)
MNKAISILLLAIGLPVGAVTAPAEARDPAQDLHELFRDHHRWQTRQFPEYAMRQGNYSFADRITDTSLDAIERRHEETKDFLERLRAIDRSALRRDNRLNYDLFELTLSRSIEGHQYRMFLTPIGGRFGPHTRVPQMAERVRFRDGRDYESYLSRLMLVGKLTDDTIEKMRLGLRELRTPPKVTLAGIPGQFDAILDGGLEALGEPFENLPETIKPETRLDLRRRFEVEALPAVTEAMERLRSFTVKEYLPKTRDTTAAFDLPDGEAFYAYQLRVMTTTEMTARDIHQLGLAEVERIKAEMLEVIRKTDFMELNPSVRELNDEALFLRFIQYLRTDSRFYYDDPEELLRGYRDICKRVDPWLPKLFETIPRLPYGVKAIPEFMAADQTTAYYSQGDIRNAEPGWFYANTYALDQRPRYEMIALALHEAVPGHHFQIALAQELEDLPQFRKDGYFTAFGEGWALYAERLGIEMGLYTDPYDDFGRLLYEMWRASRLVVDTGMHAFYWSRSRAIQFMKNNTALSELNIENEIDRYLNWPGQACAYKIGELKIRELRERAEQQMGKAFKLRDFHDELLGAGALPLTILEERMVDYIDRGTIRAYD